MGGGLVNDGRCCGRVVTVKKKKGCVVIRACQLLEG